MHFHKKDWEKSDQNSCGSYILEGKVDAFGIRFDLLAWIRYEVQNCCYQLYRFYFEGKNDVWISQVRRVKEIRYFKLNIICKFFHQIKNGDT